MKIYLIRHGQTDWNIAGKIQGNTDIPLNSTGKRQAECLAEGMRLRPVSRVFSSDLQRAADTAAVIGKLWNVEVELMRGLREVGFGSWEGMTWKEIQEAYPKEHERWCLNPVDVAPPGGELQREIRRRVGDTVEEILKCGDGDIAIVSHGATLAYVVEYLMRDHPSEEEIIVHNASITTIQYSPLMEDFILLESNDTGHLDKML